MQNDPDAEFQNCPQFLLVENFSGFAGRLTPLVFVRSAREDLRRRAGIGFVLPASA